MLMCVLNMPLLFFVFFCFPEIEAKEACDWLRAAGFPQYAQLYEGNTHIHTRDTPRVVSIYPAPLSHTKTCMFNSAPGFLSLTPCIIFFHRLCFFILSHCPSIVVSPSSGPLLSISRLQFLSREMGHGKGLVITAGTCRAFLSSFFHFSPSTLSFSTAFLTVIPRLSKPAFSYRLFLSYCLSFLLSTLRFALLPPCEKTQSSGLI